MPSWFSDLRYQHWLMCCSWFQSTRLMKVLLTQDLFQKRTVGFHSSQAPGNKSVSSRDIWLLSELCSAHSVGWHNSYNVHHFLMHSLWPGQHQNAINCAHIAQEYVFVCINCQFFFHFVNSRTTCDVRIVLSRLSSGLGMACGRDFTGQVHRNYKTRRISLCRKFRF